MPNQDSLNERLSIAYTVNLTARVFIHELLRAAHEHGKDDQVAYYLVGASLQLAAPTAHILSKSDHSQDALVNPLWDFLIGSTAFHVTVAPQPGVYQRCKRNLEDGFRVFLLVPDDVVFGARQIAETTAPGQIAVESIESFVAQNIEELATFSQEELRRELRLLLEMYNKRVDTTEIDKSMMIELPENLRT